jgi:hypothetical protein
VDVVEPVAVGEYHNNELGRASFTCSIGDWNPDWDVFIDSSWKVDENGVEINPTLYRDTELTLTWGYFGFDKNLFKPEGYSDGIYLWNPRSWQPNGDIHFTFNELVRLGTQYVLYPCIQPDLYKIWVKANTTHEYEFSNAHTYYMNPGIRNVNLGTPSAKYFRDYIGDDATEKVIDINYEGELVFDTAGGRYGSSMDIATQLGSNTIQPHKSTQSGQYPSLSVHRISLANYNGTYTSVLQPPGFTFSSGTINSSGYTDIYGVGEGYSVNINLSNFRESPTAVFGFAQPYEGRPYQHYIWDEDIKNKIIPLNDTTNLKGYNNLQTKRPTYEPRPGAGKVEIGDVSLTQTFRGLIYGAQSYETFMLQHWWVPVPKGMWYRFNGQELRIPDNGLFDIMTGDFRANFRQGDGYTPTDKTSSGTTVYPSYIEDGKEYIFFRNQKPVIGTEFNYFDDWFYQTTDINYIVKTNADTNTYEHPDKYSTGMRTLATGLVFPVSKLTADADNRVVGEWYFSGDQWLDSSNTSIHAGTFDKNKLTKLQQTFCLVKPVGKETYYVYLDPSAVGTVGEKSNASYGSAYVDTAFYHYVDANGNKFFFDGAYWVPEKYTSFNTTELNKNYAIVPNNLPFYTHPILDDAYIAGNYHYGERITVPYVATQDPEWGYTGIGWIRLNSGTVSEIL